jgi:hypothetical protein
MLPLPPIESAGGQLAFQDPNLREKSIGAGGSLNNERF